MLLPYLLVNSSVSVFSSVPAGLPPTISGPIVSLRSVSSSADVIVRILEALESDEEASPLAQDLRGLWEDGKWSVDELGKVAAAQRSRLSEEPWSSVG